MSEQTHPIKQHEERFRDITDDIKAIQSDIRKGSNMLVRLEERMDHRDEEFAVIKDLANAVRDVSYEVGVMSKSVAGLTELVQDHEKKFIDLSYAPAKKTSDVVEKVFISVTSTAAGGLMMYIAAQLLK